MEEHGTPFSLLILLLTQFRPVSLRVTPLTVGRPSTPIIFQGNALLWWNHFSLEAPSLFPNYSSLFQVDKKLTSTSPLFTKSHPTWMIHYTNSQLIGKVNLTPTITTIYRRNWSYLSGLQPIFLLKAEPSQFIFREINIILEINLCPCFLIACIFIAGPLKPAQTFMFVLFAAHDLKWHTEVLQNGFVAALKLPPLLNRIHLLATSL